MNFVLFFYETVFGILYKASKTMGTNFILHNFRDIVECVGQVVFQALLSECMFGTDNVFKVRFAGVCCKCECRHLLLTAIVAGKMVIACVQI